MSFLINLIGKLSEAQAYAGLARSNATTEQVALLSDMQLQLTTMITQVGEMVNNVPTSDRSFQDSFRSPRSLTSAFSSPKEETPKHKITPRKEFVGTHKMWSLDPDLSVDDINKILKDCKTRPSDDGKVKHEWDFYIDGQACGIWDFKGSRWSAYGPKELLVAVGLTVVN